MKITESAHDSEMVRTALSPCLDSLCKTRPRLGPHHWGALRTRLRSAQTGEVVGGPGHPPTFRRYFIDIGLRLDSMS
jgi:hypothetical protein